MPADKEPAILLRYMEVLRRSFEFEIIKLGFPLELSPTRDPEVAEWHR